LYTLYIPMLSINNISKNNLLLNFMLWIVKKPINDPGLVALGKLPNLQKCHSYLLNSHDVNEYSGALSV
jgi:hypothetical protein